MAKTVYKKSKSEKSTAKETGFSEHTTVLRERRKKCLAEKRCAEQEYSTPWEGCEAESSI